MKKLTAFILAFVLVFSLCIGVSANADNAETATREFTDDCGRTVMLPEKITKVAVSGPLAQIYVFPLCPDNLVGFCSSYSEDAAKYINEKYLDLPELGQLYGGKGTMNLEEVLAAAPEVIIDVGEAKGTIVEDLDALTEQVGIPFVHIDATVATAAEAYNRLGELLGVSDKADQLSAWCSDMYGDLTAIMEKVDADGARKKLAYCLGPEGLNVLAQGSFHAQPLNLVADNVAVIDDVVPSGLGNEIDMEQLMLWDPEYIVFAPDSIYESVAEDAAWQGLTAIKNGNFYQTPYGPYGWLASPPAVQSYLGMMWLCSVLYPDYVDYDLQEKVTEYYDLFYGYELTSDDYQSLTQGALK